MFPERDLLFCAEASSNHNGEIGRAIALVDVAASVGFDAVKFQVFRVDDLFAPEAQRAKPELAARRAWELQSEFVPELSRRARSHGMLFSCTPFSLDLVDIIAPHADFLKIASYELLWTDLLIACAQTELPIVLSTGMATGQEVDDAVLTLRSHGCSNLTLLHCVSTYPASAALSNLAAIETIRNRTLCKAGWSDHSNDPAVIHRAVHRWGASFVELHIDIDGEGAEFSPGHCWLPETASRLIRDIRVGTEADGNGRKEPAPSEEFERGWRADPSDGLRPLLAERARLSGSQSHN